MQELNPAPTPPAAGDEETLNANGRHMPRPHHHGNTLLMKIIGPVLTFVDRPWKASAISILLKRKLNPDM